MTYREAQKKLEENGLNPYGTLVEDMIQGWEAPWGDGEHHSRNWDDEINEDDRKSLNKVYGWAWMKVQFN